MSPRAARPGSSRGVIRRCCWPVLSRNAWCWAARSRIRVAVSESLPSRPVPLAGAGSAESRGSIVWPGWRRRSSVSAAMARCREAAVAWTDHDHLHECNGLRRYDQGERWAVHDHLQKRRETTQARQEGGRELLIQEFQGVNENVVPWRDSDTAGLLTRQESAAGRARAAMRTTMISVSAADQVWRWPCGADGPRRMLGAIPGLSASSWLVWTPT